jgi:hypothetical protein
VADFDASNMVARLAAYKARLEQATDEAARQIAEKALQDGNANVPVATGALKSSGRVEQSGDGQYSVGWGAGLRYAVIVHEKLSLNHPNGSAKWGEMAMRNAQATAGPTAARIIRSQTGA